MTLPIATCSAPSISASIPIEKMGPPGIITHLDVVPIFSHDEGISAGENRLKDTTRRRFRVTARLARNYDIQQNINFAIEEGSGDSLLSFPQDAAYLKVDTRDGQFVIFPNNERRCSTVRFDCTAQTSEEAQRLFHKMVAPALNHLSYMANVPLHVVQISVVDEVHHISSTDVLCPYPVVVLNSGIGKVRSQLWPVYAMYREAVNASSPFYKFFCFYKILEGLLKHLQGNLYTEAKRKNITLPSLQAKVPKYEGIPEDQKPYVGKSVTRFFDEVLTNCFRNSMAHFISDEGAVLNVTNAEEMERYSSAVHIADICCREVIRHFEECIDTLEQVHA